jgi:hypothetical protein
LSYFYDNFRNLIQNSNLETNITSLRLVYLYASGNNVEYYSFLESLPAHLKNDAKIQIVEEFANFIDMGNYSLAFDAVEKISPVHKQVLKQFQETQKRE